MLDKKTGTFGSTPDTVTAQRCGVTFVQHAPHPAPCRTAEPHSPADNRLGPALGREDEEETQRFLTVRASPLLRS